MNGIKINNGALNNEPNYSNSDSLAVKHNLDVTFDLPPQFVTPLCKIPTPVPVLEFRSSFFHNNVLLYGEKRGTRNDKTLHAEPDTSHNFGVNLKKGVFSGPGILKTSCPPDVAVSAILISEHLR